MVKNKHIGVGLCSVILMSLGANKAVFAAEYPQNETTEGKIEFKLDDSGITLPLDPENPDPENPIIPDIPGGKTNGALRLDHISQINFGSDNKIIAKRQNYYAKFEEGVNSSGEKITYPSYVQVSDERGGTKGWSVNVKNDGTFKSADGTKQFSKTKLHIKLSGVHSGSNIVNPSEFPTSPTEELDISTDSPVVLMSAESSEKQGYGIWTAHFGDSSTITSGKGVDGNQEESDSSVDETKSGRNANIRLEMPAGTIVEPDVSYSTNLIWEITDTY